jgi:hypothetical protein
MLYSNVIISKGYLRSLISNLQKGQVAFIRNNYENIEDEVFDSVEKCQDFISNDSFLNSIMTPLDFSHKSPFFIRSIILRCELGDFISDTIKKLNSKYIVFDRPITSRDFQFIRENSDAFYEFYINEKFWKSEYKFAKPMRSSNYRTLGTSIVSIEYYCETVDFNPFFNEKIYFLKDGSISLDGESKFLNKDSTSKEITTKISKLNLEKKSIWYSSKNKTDICSDCEFSGVCTDNRVPLKRKKDEWYHQSECNYNPYIAKWQGEDDYKTLKECGVTSDENGLQINHKQLEEINTQLWED